MKYYIFSILIYYISFVLFIIRIIATKDEINIKTTNKRKIFKLFRMVMASLLPIINIVISIAAIYVALLMSDNKYIEFMNE
jgi:hypothetical protein